MSNANPPLPDSTREWTNQSNQVRVSEPHGTPPLRPDAEEGALAWGYLAVVAAIFVGLIALAWGCSDRTQDALPEIDTSTEETGSDFQSTVATQQVTTTTVSATLTADDVASLQAQINEKLAADKINFEPEQATISSGEATITAIAQLVKGKPVRVKVEGYTDAAGDEAENLTLSQQRAATVKDKLIAQGVPATAVTTEGFGETKAVQDNPSGEQKAADRRIEVKISAS